MTSRKDTTDGTLAWFGVAVVACPGPAWRRACPGSDDRRNRQRSTGGVLPGVAVRAVHEATGTQFETVTDERGVFRIPVRIGVYRITAELSGFATLQRSGLEVLVGQQIALESRDVALHRRGDR